eukprot:5108683-Pleurochrysis_carterae.AAC.1
MRQICRELVVILIAVYAVPVQAPRQRPTFAYSPQSSEQSRDGFGITNVSTAAFGAVATTTAIAAAAALRS